MILPDAELLLAPWCLFILGLLVGSFLNVVIHRLPMRMERRWVLDCAEVLGVKLALPQPTTLDVSIAKAGVTPAPAAVQVKVPGPITLSTPRSRCPSCQHQITWYENIPVLSYLWLRGKCSSCKSPISLRYPFIELATAVLFAAVGWRFGPQWTTLLWCGFVATLVALSAIDWDTTFLFDDVTLPLLWAGLVAAAMGWTLPLTQSLWGAVAGFLSLFLIAKTFELVTRRGEPAMGAGDFKLLAALGAWLGVQMLVPLVLAASLVGAVVGIAMKFGPGLREGRYVPFGPFLAGGAVLVMLAGPQRVMGWLGWV
ncbi:MAG: hypothetical protein RLZZ618_2402 [Pseudomonadota bacterium]|jgi:leader peptidase (prepilin peptidase)/N-methyltransferase